MSRRIRSVSAILAGLILLSAFSAWTNPLRRIVEFQPGTPIGVQQQIIEASNSTLLRLLPIVHAASIILPADNPEGALEILTGAAEVVAVHADAALNAQTEVNDEGAVGSLIKPTAPPPPGWSWNMEIIGRDQLNIESPGAGIHVAVVDTGIDATHPALAGLVVNGYDATTGPGSVEGGEVEGGEGTTAAYTDCNGHGTHVAGIIASATSGVASDVKLHAVRVLDCFGDGFSSDLMAGLSWVYEQPEIRVVNISIGFYKNGSYPLLRKVIQALYDAGVTLVVSAGNYRSDCVVGDGTDRRFEIYGDGCNTRVKFPARYRETIAVAASDIDDQITYYSIHGPEVDLTAPGGTRFTPVVSTHSAGAVGTDNSSSEDGGSEAGGSEAEGSEAEGSEVEGGEVEGSEVEGGEVEGGEVEGGEVEGGEVEGGEVEGGEVEGGEVGTYGTASGTSMAAPHVTGAAALILQINENFTPDDIRAIMQSTADIFPYVPPSAQGAGRLNLVAALAAAENWSAADTDEYNNATDNNLMFEESFIIEDNIDINNSDYVHVHQNAVLNTNVTLGEGAWVRKQAILGTNIAIGHYTHIGKKVQIGDPEADLYGVSIGDWSSIGKRTSIGFNSLVGHYTTVRKKVYIGNLVTIGDYVYIGKKAEICDGTVIPDYSVIPPNAKVGCP